MNILNLLHDDRRKFLAASGTLAAHAPPKTELLLSITVALRVEAHQEKQPVGQGAVGLMPSP